MNRFVHAIFCDDIRFEVGNKVSLVGIYGTDLFLQEIPLVLPGLGIYATIASLADKPIQSLLVIVKFEEQVLIEQQVDLKELVEGHGKHVETTSPSTNNQNPTLQMLKWVMKISPFPVTSAGILRVIAKTESEELRCPALRIGLLPKASDKAASPQVTDKG